MSGRRCWYRVSLAAAVVLLLALITPATASSQSQEEPPPERATSAAPAGEPEFVPGRVVVKAGSDPAFRALESVNERLGTRTEKVVPSLDLKVVEFDRDRPVGEVLAAYRRDPRVEYAEPDFLRYPMAAPDDPRFGEQWGLSNTGQSVGRVAGTPGADIDAVRAWETSRGDPAVVALVDTGVNIDHPDLSGNIWTNPGETENGRDDDGNGYVDDINGWNFYDDDNTIFDEFDGEEHGTHTAGTLAAVADNGEGIAGVAPGAGLMPLKACGAGTCSSSAIAAAFDYAARNGAQVVNGSFGGGNFSQAERDAIERGGEEGVLFVFPAGNAGSDNDQTPFYPASYDNENIISVAASNNRDGLGDFSNYGAASVDLAAPGVGILSTGTRAGRAPVAVRVGEQSIHAGFGLEQIDGVQPREEFLGNALSELTSGPSTPILLVDDDGGDAHEIPYREALASLGYTDVTVEEAPPGADGPSAGDLRDKTVIWLTGAEYEDTLRQSDQESLSAHLDGGGRLLLMGQDIGYDIGGGRPGTEPAEFYAGKLKARLVSDDFDPDSVSGPPGGAFGEGSYRLSGGDSAGYDRYIDRLDYAVGGSAALLSDAAPVTYTRMSGTSMAAPHVSGVAALLASHEPSAGYREIKAAILDSARKVTGLEGRTATGGRLDANAALARISPSEPAATSLTLSASDETLSYGESVALTGRLAADGQGLAGREITLIQRTLSEGSFSPVEGGELTTDAQGNFSTEGVQPEKNTIYRATFGGDEGGLQPSASAPLRVNVSADILLNMGANEISAGQRVAMGGIVSPNKAGSEVEIRIRQAGKIIARENVTLDENSRYKFVYRAERPGNYVVRALIRGDQDNLGRISNVEKIKATR